MNFEIKTLSWQATADAVCDALIVLVPASSAKAIGASGKATGAQTKQAKTSELEQLMRSALQHGDLDTAPGKLLQCYRPQGVRAPRVILAGAGTGSARDISRAVAAAFGAYKPVKALKTATVMLCLTELPDLSGPALQAAMHAAAAATYTYTTSKSKPEPRKINQITVNVAHPSTAKTLASDFAQAQAGVQGVEFAKEWANRPANYATPTMLAQAAQSLVKPKSGIRCEVLGPQAVAALGMGSFMSVAQGSGEPLRFIVLHYNGAAKSQAPTVLVGKGITFDTGGISIKPAADMDEMKFDMGGAASVLGTFKALSVLKPAINVVGLIPSCDNMPDGKAVKPGDVVTSMSGQTIEILNTDAEGRLILCDALTYAERLKPRVVVDIATLTGACVVALGHLRSGLFTADDALASALQKAGEEALDPCWRMPLDDDYAEGLKSNFADVANVGGRAGGAITAAKFLQRFATQYPWAHLDIAGTAWKSGAAKGSTGRPVSLLLNYLVASVNIAQAAIKK